MSTLKTLSQIQSKIKSFEDQKVIINNNIIKLQDIKPQIESIRNSINQLHQTRNRFTVRISVLKWVITDRP